MPEVSVIVSVYRAEKYIERCIESVLGQTYKDFELILVDDGSPHRCPEICDDYAKIDDRIRVIHKVNGGVSAARTILFLMVGTFMDFYNLLCFVLGVILFSLVYIGLQWRFTMRQSEKELIIGLFKFKNSKRGNR